MMMQSGVPVEQRKYSSTLDCFSKTLSQEGYTGFFKGNMANIVRSIGSALVLVLYDDFQRWFGGGTNVGKH